MKHLKKKTVYGVKQVEPTNHKEKVGKYQRNNGSSKPFLPNAKVGYNSISISNNAI